MEAALRQSVVLGPVTNISFLLDLMAHPAFVSGDTHTGFLNEHFSHWQPQKTTHFLEAALAVALSQSHDNHIETTRQKSPETPWQRLGGHIMPARKGRVVKKVPYENDIAMKTTLHSQGMPLTVEYSQKGETYEAVINEQALRARLLSFRDGSLTLLVNDQPLQIYIARDGRRTLVAIDGQVYEFMQAQEQRGRAIRSEASRLDPEIRSPMPGKILQILVAAEAQVEAGQPLVLLEAMKMENALTAEGAARVKKVLVSPGDLVDLGQLLIELEFTAASDVG
jgi:acetyl/propionyl-CoA carboxylase alpha subunit